MKDDPEIGRIHFGGGVMTVTDFTIPAKYHYTVYIHIYFFFNIFVR